MIVQAPHLSHPKYRADIDGLRAIAVLGVVVFHAFPSAIKGGFIGVDVFFVISGYLISTIIFESLDRGTFSFSDFYARRIKRIFPALILVLASCFAFGWFALLADEFKQLGRHIASGAAFVSNILLWSEVGYFDNSAETKPLLHLWSLGIEEQFYIIWPVIAWLAWRRRFNLLSVAIIFTAVSFILNIKGVKQDPAATFYLPKTRFWELFCGGFLAWGTLYKSGACGNFSRGLDHYLGKVFRFDLGRHPAKAFSNLLSLVGVIFLIYGFFGINKGLAFPGKWALVPVIGAVLIISAGSDAWLNRRFLSNRILVFVGIISFPLYLWHWPLLSFARIVEGDIPAFSIRFAAVALSFLLAWLTYRFIESPVRFGRPGKAVVGVLVLMLSTIGFIGYNAYQRDGLKFRAHAILSGYSGDIGHLEYHKFIAEKYFTCTPEAVAKEALRWEGFIRCIQSKPSSDVDIALLGDSHAEHLFLGMAEALPSKNVGFYIKSSAPFIGNPEFKTIFDNVLASRSISDVVLTMFWISRQDQIPAGSSLEAELIKVIDLLNASGKKVYLTDDIPSFKFVPDRCKGQRWLATQNPYCEMSVEESMKQAAVYSDALLSVVKSRPHVKIIRVGRYVCGDASCSMTRGGEILYRDNNHLNINGSIYVGRSLVKDNPDIFK